MKRASGPRTLLAVVAALTLQGCGTPRPQAQHRDGEFASAMQRGRGAFARRQYDVAVVAFQHALRRGRMLDDPGGIGDSSYNLATVLVALGQFDDARPYLDDALAAFAQVDARAGLAEVNVLMARVAVAKRDPAAAREHLASAVKSLTDDMQRSDVAVIAHLMRAELACEANDSAGAYTALGRALKAGARASAQPAIRAQTAAVEGKLATLTGAHLQAARHFDAAAAAYGEAGRAGDVARTLAAAAAQYEAAGANGAAAERHYRSARSYHAQALPRRAIDEAMAAAAAARKSGDDGLANRASELLDTVREALKRASDKEAKE